MRRTFCFALLMFAAPSLARSQVVGERPDCGDRTVAWETVVVFRTLEDVPDSVRVKQELGPALANGLDGMVKTLRGFPGEPDPLDLRKQYAAVWLCANAIILNEELVDTGRMCNVRGEVQPCPPQVRQRPVAVWIERVEPR